MHTQPIPVLKIFFFFFFSHGFCFILSEFKHRNQIFVYRFPPTRGAAFVAVLAALGALGALAAGLAAGAAFFEVVTFCVRLTSLAARMA